MFEMENWKDIEGYEGLYQVSDLGRVRSLHWSGRILKPAVSKSGRARRGSYAKVVLCKDGKPINFEVHRLVARAFVPNPESLPVVNHMDSNSLNNLPANLEWCTIAHNNRHAVRNGRKSIINRSTFNKSDRAELNKLFDAGVGVTAISCQLNIPYNAVRYVYRLRNNSQK